ncbi:glycosyltransferase family 4 protein [Maribrevibacterium harenarium]|uniref:Glycosyltransferase family 4 protein n=1 Tax=Maribrevibacterium harenarium TaxID=2589817 RepID=A0A501X2E9_9GAMM|nr:glycosyltransferase family 4 protein [Maribrevibacterium harenarium]TPE54660.1 glycosyltransferase family 4 protein [Maribrevibacterium harenarium]
MHITHVNLAKGFRGGERQTAILITELSKNKDISQQLVCRKDSPLRDHLSKVQNLKFIDANHQLCGHFSVKKTDIIHAHEAKAVHWAFLQHLLKKTPYILTRRVDTPIKKKLLNKLTYSNASRRIAISRLIKEIINEKGWGDADLIFSTKGDLAYDDDSSKLIRMQFKNKKLVGHIGALVDRHKGQKLIIESAHKLEKTHPHLHFLCLGEGRDQTELMKLSQQLNNISWLGFKDNIGDYINAFDYFIFPSRNEGLGSTLLDVIDAGVPIIASDAGGIPDIINGTTGISIPSNDPQALTEAIIKLDSDTKLQQELVSNAKKHLFEFSPQYCAQKYLEIYNITRKN